MKQEEQEVFSPRPFYSPLAMLDWFQKAILSGEPASLIRLGDGEFSWLGYDSIVPWGHTSRSLRIWFGHDRFRREQLTKTAERLRQAVRSATAIGIPRASRQRKEIYCQPAKKIFNSYGLARAGQLYTDCGVHRFWQMRLGYRDLLQGLPFLGIVTSKDICAGLRETFGIGDVTLYPIPSE